MALDVLTVGAPSRDSSWPGALPSSDGGAHADVLAFLQAMVGASESADNLLALAAVIPEGSGESVTPGPVPPPSGAPAWDAVLAQARLHSATLSQLMHEMRALSAQLDATSEVDPAEPPQTDAAPASCAPTGSAAAVDAEVAAVSLFDALASPEGEDLDEDAAATAFLIAAATMPPLQTPVIPTADRDHAKGTRADGKILGGAAIEEFGAEAPAAVDDRSTSAQALQAALVGVSIQVAAAANVPTAPAAPIDEALKPSTSLPVTPPAVELVTPPAVETVANELPLTVLSELGSDADALQTRDHQVDEATHLGPRVEETPPSRIDSPRVLARAMADDDSSPAPSAATEKAQPQEARRTSPAGSQPLSPRAHAFMRAMQQTNPAIFTTDDSAAVTLDAENAQWPDLVDRVVETLVARRPAAERSVSPSMMSSSAEAPSPASAADADMLAMREQIAITIAGQRSMSGALSSNTSGGSREREPQTLLHRDGRHVAPASAALLPATVLFAPSQAASLAIPDVDAPPPSGPALPNEAGVAASLVRSMQWQYRNGVGAAVVNLDPGYLGEVKVALQVNGASVSATMHAANPEVRAWMQANEGALRQSLADQGLTLERLIVAEEESPSRHSSPDGRRQDDHQQERPRPRRTQRSDEGQTFEVVV